MSGEECELTSDPRLLKIAIVHILYNLPSSMYEPQRNSKLELARSGT